ncbi:hypothetical protein AYM40_07380 [Paraburkholderia phytofirmans OLGA172]|uniref:BON domain-containing protein n=1 Tax=Paraburkholderia phytofirmans OLGA172 TaxID=1417228 RepID=A0A160FJR1_9BURK|nr:BON domain-containing protein [Paraburkholderia phytofirmans]ANB72206.1 hypothetical protein AYM40_07380 [Paraburkholderia phytofirmans OLGA172]
MKLDFFTNFLRNLSIWIFQADAMRSAGLIASIAACAAMTGVPLAYGQTTNAVATDTASAVTTPSKKEIRSQNRALAKNVRKALTKVKGLDSSGISILAKGGVVTLAGSTQDEKDIGLAEDAAKGVTGVTSVQNRLTVHEVGH